MALQKRIAEAQDAIINMHVNGIAINAISRTLRISPATIRNVLNKWQATVGAVAVGRAKLTAAIEPACATVAQAVKRDDKAAFRLLEGMGVLGDARTGQLQDKAISISINNLLSAKSSTTTLSTQPNDPSSRKGPAPTMQLHNGMENFSEISQVADNKEVSGIGVSDEVPLDD